MRQELPGRRERRPMTRAAQPVIRLVEKQPGSPDECTHPTPPPEDPPHDAQIPQRGLLKRAHHAVMTVRMALVRRAVGAATVVGSRCRGLLVGACEWQPIGMLVRMSWAQAI